VKAEDSVCPSCGIPLPPDHGKLTQRKFIWFFIAVVVFSLSMMMLVPLMD
jgi:hypothetical protein